VNPAAAILSSDAFAGAWFTRQYVDGDRVHWDAINAGLLRLSSGERKVVRIAQALELGWDDIDQAHRDLIRGVVSVA